MSVILWLRDFIILSLCDRFMSVLLNLSFFLCVFIFQIASKFKQIFVNTTAWDCFCFVEIYFLWFYWFFLVFMGLSQWVLDLSAILLHRKQLHYKIVCLLEPHTDVTTIALLRKFIKSVSCCHKCANHSENVYFWQVWNLCGSVCCFSIGKLKNCSKLDFFFCEKTFLFQNHNIFCEHFVYFLRPFRVRR